MTQTTTTETHMNSIILVYELVPEDTRIYHLYVDNATAEKIKSAHLKFGNTDTEDESTDWLSEYLTDKTPLISADADGSPLEVPTDSTVVLSGFML